MKAPSEGKGGLILLKGHKAQLVHNDLAKGSSPESGISTLLSKFRNFLQKGSRLVTAVGIVWDALGNKIGAFTGASSRLRQA